MVKGGTIPACNVKEIAFDGVYLDAVRSQYNSQTYLTVGARVDWLVYCNIVGEYEVESVIIEIYPLLLWYRIFCS